RKQLTFELDVLQPVDDKHVGPPGIRGGEIGGNRRPLDFQWQVDLVTICRTFRFVPERNVVPERHQRRSERLHVRLDAARAPSGVRDQSYPHYAALGRSEISAWIVFVRSKRSAYRACPEAARRRRSSEFAQRSSAA